MKEVEEKKKIDIELFNKEKLKREENERLENQRHGGVKI